MRARRAARRLSGFLLAMGLTVLCARAAGELPEPAPGGVLLSEERTFEVTDPEQARETVRARLRIDDSTGRRHARLVILTHEFVQLASLEAEVFDARGRRIRAADQSEAQIHRPDEAVHLASDARAYRLDLDPGTYPCEIAYSYELRHASLLYWPDWTPQGALPVTQAAYELRVPASLRFHTLALGGVGAPDTLATQPELRLRWSVANLEPWDEERLAPHECSRDRRAGLLLCPDEFVLAGYPGDLTSWDAFGDWYRRLAAERYDLRPAARESIARAVAGCATDGERLATLLGLLQARTRYVAIELGLGSFRPPPAEQTYARRYGDCKGLVTLMIAMCRVAGLAAHPALVLTRDRGRIPGNFITPMFNHVLVWVPVDSGAERDTVWIECTSDHVMPGELPWQCEGCDALLIGPEGSRLGLTPVSRAEDNRQTCVVAGEVAANGDLALDVRLELTGDPLLSLAEELAARSPREQCTHLEETLGDRYPSLDVRGAELRPDSSAEAGVLTFSATLPGYWRSGADRVLCNPVVLGGLGVRALPPAEGRSCPLLVRFPDCVEYQISVRVPEGFEPELLPAELVQEGAGFTHSLAHAWDAGTWRIATRCRCDRALIDPDDYAAYREAVEGTRRAQAAPVVFRRAPADGR